LFSKPGVLANWLVNIHHLELFYYVARHGGISEAVRNIPYGIQQPAVSGQILELEEFLGTPLFQRRPFNLSPAGEELYAFIKPFFDNLQAVGDKLRGGAAQTIRIGGSEIVLRHHLPGILTQLRKQFPHLKVTLREGYHPQLLHWLEKQDLDLALTILGGKPPPGINVLILLKLPLVLLVPKESKIKSAWDLWDQDRISETLITVPANEPMWKAFQEGLAKLEVDWHTGIEITTVDLIQTYVAGGYGIGLGVGVPKYKYHPQVRVLPLDGFEALDFGILWQGKLTPIMSACIETVKQTVKALLS
jgi:DNA-binding transcriptional LysR family regulator